MLISQTITDALIELGVINPIDEASPQDHAYGLRTLNRIIDLYNAQGITITHTQHLIYQEPDTFWGASVTIGSGLEIDSVAPIDIQTVFFRESGGTDYKLTKMSVDEWTSIGQKFTSSIPLKFYEQKIDNNNVKIYFDYVPQTGLELHIMAKMPYLGVNGVGDAYVSTDDIEWGYGLEKLLMNRLALELAPTYEIQPSNILVVKVLDAEKEITTKNFQPRTLSGSWEKRRVHRNRARY